jgi:hypothetical protein
MLWSVCGPYPALLLTLFPPLPSELFYQKCQPKRQSPDNTVYIDILNWRFESGHLQQHFIVSRALKFTRWLRHFNLQSIGTKIIKYIYSWIQ